ncbi:MAG TPA: rRNA maturation RNase YbeY [Acidimicrobiales bacterium]|nr:rRNA maturation RNase YbeY [Acidimicrobiales bacterium]
MEVFVADEQADVAVDTGRYADLATRVLEDEGVRGDIEFALLFVDEATMAELNSTHMGKSGPTDVLAFPIDQVLLRGGRMPDASRNGPPRRDPPAAEGPILLGDVVVCPAVAGRNAADHGVSVCSELDLLVVHGILHVLGMDHAEPGETEAMKAREQMHLAAFAAARGEDH